MAHLSLEKFMPSAEERTLETFDPMTRNGVIVRTVILLAVTVAFGAVGWLVVPGSPTLMLGATIGAVAGAVVFGIWAARKPLNAKVPAFGYAAAQGILIGAISAGYAGTYEGIIQQALMLTAVCVAVTLGLYASGLVKVNRKFGFIIVAATLAVMGYYLIAFAMSFFGVQAPLIWDSGPIGIMFSVLVLGLAAANLFLDYETVTQAIDSGADERFEWYAAFGITATVLWVYLEALRLLGKMRN